MSGRAEYARRKLARGRVSHVLKALRHSLRLVRRESREERIEFLLRPPPASSAPPPMARIYEYDVREVLMSTGRIGPFALMQRRPHPYFDCWHGRAVYDPIERTVYLDPIWASREAPGYSDLAQDVADLLDVSP